MVATVVVLEVAIEAAAMTGAMEQSRRVPHVAVLAHLPHVLEPLPEINAS